MHVMILYFLLPVLLLPFVKNAVKSECPTQHTHKWNILGILYIPFEVTMAETGKAFQFLRKCYCDQEIQNSLGKTDLCVSWSLGLLKDIITFSDIKRILSQDSCMKRLKVNRQFRDGCTQIKMWLAMPHRRYSKLQGLHQPAPYGHCREKKLLMIFISILFWSEQRDHKKSFRPINTNYNN